MIDKNRTAWFADWGNPHDQANIRHIREQVFIKEQHVPVELEWDELDETCTHLLATNPAGQPIATARIHIDGSGSTAHIGRMSVLPAYRHQGIASEMLSMLLGVATTQHCDTVELNAQTTAIPFYELHGFKKVGDEFLDAGIPHFKMLYTLSK